MATELSYINNLSAFDNRNLKHTANNIKHNIYYSSTYSTKFCLKYTPNNYISFHYSLKGSFVVELEFPKISFIIHEGEIFIAKPQSSYIIKNQEYQLTGIITLHIAEEKFQLLYKSLLNETGVFYNFYNTDNELFAKPNFNALSQYEHSLFQHLLDLFVSKDLYAKLTSQDFLELTFRHLLLLIDHNFKENELHNDSVEAIINNYIEDNLCSANLTELAKLLHYNHSYVSEIVSKVTGNNFKFHLREARLKKAAQLLKNPMLSIENIYQSVGYENYSSFITAFKDKYGKTPKEYRNKIIPKVMN